MTQFAFWRPGATENRPNSTLHPTHSEAGFTLIETVVVAAILATIAAIALPSWLGFLDQRRVNVTQAMIYQALRQTQQEASQNLRQQQFSLRERDGRLEWASHPVSVSTVQVSHWTPLIEGVTLANEDNTLPKSGEIRYARFDHLGNTSSLGRVTLVGSGGRTSHRCVVVATLLGAMRQGKGHTKPNEHDRHCY